MSKSLGTGVDPLVVVKEYGADALRYTLITSSGPGNDLKLSLQRVEAGRNFANKLWNAARFVIAMIGEGTVRLPEAMPGTDAPLEDRWIMSRVEELARSVDALMQRFEMGEAARQVYEFVWGEFADWYIEIAKVRVRGERSDGPSPLPVLAYVLDRCLGCCTRHALRHGGDLAEPRAEDRRHRRGGADRRAVPARRERLPRRSRGE
jgi:valyl-tRNA synthetase